MSIQLSRKASWILLVVMVIFFAVVKFYNNYKDRTLLTEENAKTIASLFTDDWEYKCVKNGIDGNLHYCFRDTELGFDFTIINDKSGSDLCTWDYDYCDILKERCAASLDELCSPHQAEWEMVSSGGVISGKDKKKSSYSVSLTLTESTYADERRSLTDFYKNVWETVKSQDKKNAIDELIVYVRVKNESIHEGGEYTPQRGYIDYEDADDD